MCMIFTELLNNLDGRMQCCFSAVVVSLRIFKLSSRYDRK
jgi:hypothetical protein